MVSTFVTFSLLRTSDLGKTIVPGHEGFTFIMPWLKPKTAGLPNFDSGAKVPVLSVTVTEGKTSPPDYLTESELISLVIYHDVFAILQFLTSHNRLRWKRMVLVLMLVFLCTFRMVQYISMIVQKN